MPSGGTFEQYGSYMTDVVYHLKFDTHRLSNLSAILQCSYVLTIHMDVLSYLYCRKLLKSDLEMRERLKNVVSLHDW